MKIKFKNVVKFIKARAKERSTYVGLGSIAVALGAPEVANSIVKYADIGFLVLGGSLLAADTSTPTTDG